MKIFFMSFVRVHRYLSPRALLSLLALATMSVLSGVAVANGDPTKCLGAGGTAQCTNGIGAPMPGVAPGSTGTGGWRYSICSFAASTQGTNALWCQAYGGTWDGSSANPSCQGGSGPVTSEGQASSVADAFASLRWDATPSGGGGWSSSVGDSCWGPYQGGETLGVPTGQIQELSYMDDENIQRSIWIRRDRGAVCPAGYEVQGSGATATCMKPPECEKTCTGNPVSVVSGTKYDREDDYVPTSDIGISFSRYYNSTGYYSLGDTASAFFDAGIPTSPDFWRHTYDRKLIYPDGPFSVFKSLQGPDGSSMHFDVSGDQITNRKGGGATLLEVAGGIELTLPSGDKELYVNKQLTQIISRNGRITNLAYVNGRLDNVTGPFGHTLTFAYNADGLLETVTLPDGGTLGYAYDTSGRMVALTYPDSTTRQYQYPASTGDVRDDWLLAGIVDESGAQYATYQYDSEQRVTNEFHAGGVQQYSFSYGANVGDPTQVTDPLGTITSYTFSSNGGLYRIAGYSQPCMGCGPTAATTYDANGNPATRTDFNGNQTTYVYDANRSLETSRTEAAGTPRARTITTAWHPTLNLPTSVTQPGRQTNYLYDTAGNLTSLTQVDSATSASRTWQLAYNAIGQVTSVDGPRTDVSDTTTITYHNCTTGNECGQIATVTDAVGNTTSYLTYNANGSPLTMTDANGVLTTVAYDARQRLTTMTVAQETTTYEYWPTGLVKKLTLPDGSATSYEYDTAQRLVGITAADGNRVSFTLDGAGNRIAESVYDTNDVLVRNRTYTYDSLGRLQSELSPLGNQTTYSHNLQGRVISTTDPLGRTTDFGYDELNRDASMTDALGQISYFAFDSLDNLVSVTDPRSLTTTYAFNGLGDQVSLASPDTGTTTYAHDANGDVMQATDARGESAVHTRDAIGRITQTVYGDQTLQYTYDTGTYGAGQLTGLTNGASTLAWQYDALGRITQRQQTVAGLSLNVDYAYNSVGQLAFMTTPSGQTIGYNYTDGMPTSVTVNGANLIGAITYEPLGPTTGWLWASGAATLRDYDADGRLAYLSSAGTLSFEYYDDGLIKSRADDNPSSPVMNPGTSQFAYGLTSNRLTSVSGLLARTYTYDGSGNTLGDGARSFVYDDMGRMVSATVGATTTSYAYNGIGERIRKSNVNETVHFAYDEVGQLIGEYDGTGTLIREVVWLGNIPLAVLVPDGSGGIDTYYIHTDHLNTPRRITDPTSGTIVWRWDSDPFGSMAANADPDGDSQDFGFHHRFPGQYFDLETGLHYNYYRTYDPSTGRYFESDPIGLAAGMNTYSYVSNMPMMHTDPLGLDKAENLRRANAMRGRLRGEPYLPYVYRYWKEFFGGTYDMLEGFADMYDAGTIGGDHYFHCRANCEAARRGPVGETVSCAISEARENLWNDPPAARAADEAANLQGRRGGMIDRHKSCYEVCSGLIPAHGLPRRHLPPYASPRHVLTPPTP